jgi:trans-2-enoyl-CoA reductase
LTTRPGGTTGRVKVLEKSAIATLLERQAKSLAQAVAALATAAQAVVAQAVVAQAVAAAQALPESALILRAQLQKHPRKFWL